uniref:Uncharacterized protein n=1 Tax=Moniliophthora roreri TaxID=221103 RepID=A0A0W0G2Z3_MONRR
MSRVAYVSHFILPNKHPILSILSSVAFHSNYFLHHIHFKHKT